MQSGSDPAPVRPTPRGPAVVDRRSGHPPGRGCRLHAVPVQLERRTRLPPDPRSAGRARRMLQEALRELEEPDGSPDGSCVDRGVDPDLVDTTILLASELCENAVLHAGTEFEVA